MKYLNVKHGHGKHFSTGDCDPLSLTDKKNFLLMISRLQYYDSDSEWQFSTALTLIRLLLLNMQHERSLGFEYFWESIRGLTGTPPTPLNVAALCHLTAVPIFLPYPDRDARWKQKGRQEDFNIALRSHTICPFHEPADGRGGNTSLHYKQTPAYFKVTCKSRHLQGSSRRDSSRYCEISSFWIRNDCTALDRIMFVKPYKQCLVLTPRLIISHNQMIPSVTFYVKANVA